MRRCEGPKASRNRLAGVDQGVWGTHSLRRVACRRLASVADAPWSNLKTKSDCICGCGKYGTPRKKLHRGDSIGHVTSCTCHRCVPPSR